MLQMQLIQSQDLHVTHVSQKLATNNMSSQHVATCQPQFQLSIKILGMQFIDYMIEFCLILHHINVNELPSKAVIKFKIVQNTVFLEYELLGNWDSCSL